jgi:hypothetical protein
MFLRIETGQRLGRQKGLQEVAVGAPCLTEFKIARLRRCRRRPPYSTISLFSSSSLSSVGVQFPFL